MAHAGRHKSQTYYFACNLIWWAVLGFQDVMKQQEIRINKEKETKTLRKKKPKRNLTIKLGIFLRFWPFLRPPIEVTAINS